MIWLESLARKQAPNLVKNEKIVEYFSMYRGKRAKILFTSDKLKVLQLDDMLLIEANPIIGTSIVFLEDIEGTKIVLTRQGKPLKTFIHPFIKPSMIIDKGGLIPDMFKKGFKSRIKRSMDIEFYDENEYNKLNSVDKIYYVEKTWDLSHTIIYTLLI